MPDFSKPSDRGGVAPYRPVDFERLQAYTCQPGRFFVACLLARPGALLFLTTLEYEHFQPGKPENEIFDLVLFTWEGMDFGLMGVPATFRSLVQQVANDLEMRLADGVPTLMQLGPAGAAVPAKHFPIQSPNVFTLENGPRHAIFRMSQEEAFALDQAALTRLWAEQDVRSRAREAAGETR